MIRLADLLAATGGVIHGPVFAETFTDFCYDSRLLRPGELFLAVTTDTGDGHDYITQSAARGAAGVLCQQPVDLGEQAVTCIVVDDTQAALRNWARSALRRFGPWVIGVAGSSGKTTTKELAALVLSRRFRTFRNRGNLNTLYGLTIALGRLGAEHRVAVLEMACDGVDQMRDLAALAQPRIGVVTSVNETHLAGFGSIEAIAAETARLVESLPPARDGGTAILNHDDPRVRSMAAKTAARVVTYGLSPDADVVAGGVSADERGSDFTLFVRDFAPVHGHRRARPLRIRLPLLGIHHVYAALAAITIGLVLDVPLEQALEAVAACRPLLGRLNPLPGVSDSLILDDSFSANPASTLAALDTLDLFRKGNRLVAMGELLELGSYEAMAYRLVGSRLADVADFAVLQGDSARRLAAEAQAAGLASEHVAVTYTPEDTVRVIRDRLSSGDTVLVKGAAESRMEKVVAGLLSQQDQGPVVLVRQTAGWQKVRLRRPGRPTWLEVDLEAIAHNVRRVLDIVGPGVAVLAILKADAYGHGMIRVARTALNNGASYVGVASISEGRMLRESGIQAPILVLGFTPPWQARELGLNGLTATVFDLDVARALGQAAKELGRRIRVHVKVDTGMGRLGLLPEDVPPLVQGLQRVPGLDLEGIFTHFSVSDTDPAYTRWQLERFAYVLDALADMGVAMPLVHAANSAAILTMPESHFSMVRLGIAMYGLHPSPQVKCPADFRRALSFKTQIAQVKELKAGSYVSYGNTYQTSDEQRVAVIPVGYADGFRRAPRHWGEVLVRGRRAPIIGRVCMDQTVIDVTSIPGVRQGDEVILIGEQGDQSITAEEVAERLGTINYEVVSEILARVPRVV